MISRSTNVLSFPPFARSQLESGATGNLAFDAHIAAVCLEHGVTEILTSDRDFEGFEGLKPRC